MALKAVNICILVAAVHLWLTADTHGWGKFLKFDITELKFIKFQ